MTRKTLTVLVLVLTIGLIAVTSAQSTTKIQTHLDVGKNVLIRLKDVDNGSVFYTPGIKNYGTGVAITEFQTSRKEVNLLVLIVKNGEVIEDRIMGPYETGGLIKIDVRSNRPEPMKLIEKVNDTDETSETEEVANSTNTSSDKVDTPSEEIPETSEKEQKEELTKKNQEENTEITGKSVFYSKFHDEDGSLKILYPLGAFFVFVFLLTGLILITRQKKGKKPMTELEKLQKQIEKKSKEIQAIKQARAYKSRVNQAKMELEREEEILKSLKGQEEDKEKLNKAKIELARKERILDSLKAEEKENK